MDGSSTVETPAESDTAGLFPGNGKCELDDSVGLMAVHGVGGATTIFGCCNGSGWSCGGAGRITGFVFSFFRKSGRSFGGGITSKTWWIITDEKWKLFQNYPQINEKVRAKVREEDFRILMAT